MSNLAEDWPIKHMLMSEFARYRGVSRKTVSEWKQRGLLVFGEGAGFTEMVDIAATDRRLADRPAINRGGEANQVTERAVTPRKVTGRRG
ncbi:hypothetical protein GGC47_001062 [Bosea sp. OAE752]|uniref:hypothetical protein n=1 Tax=Bosea sp. OAE752 TaxID=2663873 RepID=UPI003D236E39